MLLYLKAKLDELRVEDITFFRMAHLYQYGTDPDQWDAIAQYRMHAVIPSFVVNYLKMLQSREPSCSKTSS